MKPILSFRIVTAIAVFFGCLVGIGQEPDPVTEHEFKTESFGFKIVRPRGDWDFLDTEPKPGSLMLKVSRKDAVGQIETTVIAEPIASTETQTATPAQLTAMRDKALAKTEGQPGFSNQTRQVFTVGGQIAPGFQIDWLVQGTTYRLQQCYLSNQGLIYTVAIHSPREQFEELQNVLVEIRDSFEFVTINDKAKRAALLKKLASRCGSEVNWATTWEEASSKAKDENKSILVLIRSQSGFDIADGMTTVALMDPDIIEFLNANCIVFRFAKGMPAPFTGYDKYGIGPSSFGSTALLVDPEGTVFGDTFTYEPITFYDFLRQSFAQRKSRPADSREGASPIEWAKRLASCGDLEEAIEHLKGLSSVESCRLRASIMLRLRDPKAALQELQAARALTENEQVLVELELDEALILLAIGDSKPVEALVVFERLQREYPNHPRAAEIMFVLGVCQFATSNKDAAEKTWASLIDSFEETNRWTWLAASSLTSAGFQMNVPPEFGWPTEDTLSSFRSVPFESLAIADVEKARVDAIKLLLTEQRQDGSWISPPSSLRSKGYNTNPFTIATTSICARSLLAHQTDPDIKKRVERAFDFLVQAIEDSKSNPNTPYYMDYSPWSDGYLLRFLVRYAELNPGKRTQVERLVGETVESLSKKQKPGGGWSYYITHNLSQADQPSNQSTSFMTAAITIALLESRATGFDVPVKMTDRALDCLERMRNANQTFTYFLWHEHEASGRLDGEEGAAGRGPLCALALAKGKRGKATEVTTCLDLFLKFGHLYSRERGKSLMHASPGGEGSHYLMFDYAWAANAVASLPAEQQQEYRDRLLELVLSSRSQQGGFLDNPINGWHYGTGMALEAMDLLR